MLRAIRAAGGEPLLVSSIDEPRSSWDGFIIPGVGHFGFLSAFLRRSGAKNVLETVLENRVPLMGICLGGQILFSRSEESPTSPGLELIKGEVRRLAAGPHHRTPNVGWSTVNPQTELAHQILRGLRPDAHFYFSHSYCFVPARPEVRLADSPHSDWFCSLAGDHQTLAVQFHPEKSGKNGRKFLANWLKELG